MEGPMSHRTIGSTCDEQLASLFYPIPALYLGGGPRAELMNILTFPTAAYPLPYQAVLSKHDIYVQTM